MNFHLLTILFYFLLCNSDFLVASSHAKSHGKTKRGHGHGHAKPAGLNSAHKKSGADEQVGLMIDHEKDDEAHEVVAERCVQVIRNFGLPRSSIVTSLAELKNTNPQVHDKVKRAAKIVEEHQRTSKEHDETPANVLQAMADVEKFGRKTAEKEAAAVAKKCKGFAITAALSVIGLLMEYCKRPDCKQH